MGRRADAARDGIVGSPAPRPRERRNAARALFLLITCAGFGFACGSPVQAQQKVLAHGRADAAQQLADAALEFLRTGEDAFNEQEKRAAYEAGLSLARQAVSIDDLNADAHFAVFANHGRLQLLDGTVPNPFNLAEANRELERTLELNPDHPDGLAAKGGLYRQLPRLLGGDVERAEQLLKRSIALNPSSIGARIELARLYKDLGQAERGLPLLRAAAEVAERDERFRQLAEARQLLKEINAQ